MAVRTTVDIPEPLHDALRARSERSGSSIRSLIVEALEQSYGKRRGGKYVTGPLVKRSGKLGPAFPTDENPYDFMFS